MIHYNLQCIRRRWSEHVYMVGTCACHICEDLDGQGVLGTASDSTYDVLCCIRSSLRIVQRGLRYSMQVYVMSLHQSPREAALSFGPQEVAFLVVTVRYQSSHMSMVLIQGDVDAVPHRCLFGAWTCV